MLVQVDYYKDTGKWYSGGRVEIDKMPWESGIRDEIEKNQKILSSSGHDFFMVVSDIPESENDPNYRMTYARLYHPK